MKSHFLICFLVLSFLTMGDAWAQESPEESYRRAFHVFNNAGGEQEAVSIWLQLADNHQGEVWGARSLLAAAQWTSDFDGSLALFNRYVAEYAGTEFELSGRLGLIHHQNHANESAELLALEALLTGIGGPSRDQISDNPARSQRDIWALDDTKQRDVYRVLKVILDIRLRPNGELTEVSRNESLPLASFIYSTFGPKGIANGTDRATLKICIGVPAFAADMSEAPGLTILEPAEGASTSSTPILRANATTRAPELVAIDLTNLRVELDGQNVSQIAEITTVYSSDLSESFETISIQLSPSTPLEPGSHVFTVAAQTQTKDGEVALSTEESVSFVVLSDETETVLSPTKDSTIRAQKPHRNEGANPRLFLSHRLEARNKSLNPIVAFDLANTDLNGLTKATLVMNVQDCDLPRRWGNEGRSIEAHPITQPWTEGNGNKYRQKGQEGRTKGNGPGVTWFSPSDDEIRNNRPNSSLQWTGSRSSLGPLTAPAVRVTNGQTGPIEFDVTQDVLNGYYEGWLLKKQDEAKFGNIRFFSKEAGDSEIAPKLLLEFNGQVAKGDGSQGLLAGFNGLTTKLRPTAKGSELKNLRDVLQESSTAAVLGEGVVAFAAPNPAVGSVARLAYRAWLG